MKTICNSLTPKDCFILTTPYARYDTVAVNSWGVFPFNADFVIRYISLLPYEPFKIKLRPLTSMTPDEALQLVKTIAPEAFGDYRYRKWQAVLDEKNKPGIWTAYKITRDDKGETRSFFIDLIDGRVFMYDDTWKNEGSIAAHYRGWYYEHGFDIPTYPTGKTLQELNLAYYD